MAIKLVDELKAMGNFPIAHAEGINLVKTDGTEDNLQNLFDNGELGGGGGDSSVTLTQEEYEALSEEQKLDGLYYTYDTKRIYKNGVQYGASDAEDIGYNNAESGIQATTVQGAIDKVVKTVEDKVDKTNIVTALDNTVTDEQVTSALLTKTELDKKASKTYLGRYVFETGANSRLLYIGKIYSIGNQQGFTNIEVRGGRVDGRFGHGYIHIDLNGYVVANLEHPISNMTFFVTKEGNEAYLYCNMDTYCTLVVDVANGSKCEVIGEFVDSSSGTISWNNDWRELATMDKFTNYTKNIKIGETEDVDANNLKSNANYIFPEAYEGNVSNMPSWVKRGGGLLECKNWGNYETQVFYPYGESIVYIRSLYYYDYKLHWSGWQELATMDKVAHEVDTSYMSGGMLNISLIRQSLGVGCYEIMGQGSSGHGSIRLNIWQVMSGSIAFSCCITNSNGVKSICSNEGDSPTVDVGTSYFSTTNKIIKIF